MSEPTDPQVPVESVEEISTETAPAAPAAPEAPTPPPVPPRSRKTTAILLAVSLLGVSVFLGSAGAVAWLATRGDSAEVEEGSFLEVHLGGRLTDAPVQGGLFLDPEAAPILPTHTARAIREAADDERIAGLYLHLEGPSGGWGIHQELRDAIMDFRETGKPTVAYSRGYDNGDYYLASACEHVVLAPSGITLVNGLALEISYYGDEGGDEEHEGVFSKLGVESEMLHVGDFKSAIEPFERAGPSPAAAEAYEGMLSSLYEQMIAGIAEGRGIEVQQVHELVDDPPLSPQDALALGMIDAIAFPDVLEEHMDQVGEEGWAELLASAPVPEEPEEGAVEEEEDDSFTSLREYLKDAWPEEKEQLVAVVYAEGNIISGNGGGGLFGSEGLADGPFGEWMEEVRENDDIKAVVLRVNSPGGSGLASDMMWRDIERVKAAGRPVVVSMADYAASGGYFIAADADWIVAQPGTLTGSIGVFGGKISLAGTYDKIGINQHVFKRGEVADLSSMTRPFSDQSRAALQSYLDDFYWTFVGKVVDGRGMDKDAVHRVAQGRVWTGQQALELGLVDELGGLDVAIAKAQELAELEGEAGLYMLPREKDFFEVLMEDLAMVEQPEVQVVVPPPFDQVQEDLAQIELAERILADGPAVWMPGDLTVR